jgi:hypothetical protein
MTDARNPNAMPEIERMMTALRPHVAFPPTPDIASSIRAQIATPPARPAPAWSIWRPRRLAIAVLVLLLAGAGALAVLPDLRSALADRLGIDGIRIEFTDDVPETPVPGSPPVGVTLLLGDRLSLDEAQARVPYTIQAPVQLGSPDEVYVRQLSAGPMVSLLYKPRPGLPEAAETGVGAILMQFPAGASPAELAKRVTKGLGDFVGVDVGDAEGFWITGFSEFVIVEDPSADFDDALSRPSANVLIWQVGEVTYRLETDLARAEAIELAESIEPVAGTEPIP